MASSDDDWRDASVEAGLFVMFSTENDSKISFIFGALNSNSVYRRIMVFVLDLHDPLDLSLNRGFKTDELLHDRQFLT